MPTADAYLKKKSSFKQVYLWFHLIDIIQNEPSPLILFRYLTSQFL